MSTFSLSSQGETFKSFITFIIDLLHIINPILSLLAFIVFFWGLSKFILSSGSSTEVQKGKTYMLWGILALFILLTVNSILNIVSNELFGDSIHTPLLPTGAPTPPPPIESPNVNLDYNP
jgi:hypothetical protein